MSRIGAGRTPYRRKGAVRRSVAGALAAVVLAASGSTPLSAQAPTGAAAPEPPAFTESIDVRVINVEAVVTDRQGERVHGLTRGDFVLRLDGKEVPIDFFAEAGEETPGAAPGAAPALGTAPKGRSILVFLDDTFAVKSHRDMVLKKLGEQLAQLQPDDRVALVSFDGTRLAILSDWTSDPRVVGAALAAASRRQAHGNAMVAARRMQQDDLDFRAKVEAILRGEDDARPGAGGDTEVFTDERSSDPRGRLDPAANDRSYRQPMRPLLGSLITDLTKGAFAKIPIAVTAALRAFSNAPGRKMMLLLSGGWPTLAVVVPIAGEANRLGYTLYPVDVTGVDMAFLSNDARTDGAGSTGVGKTGWESGAEYTLEMLARATGGRALIDSTRLEALPRMLADTRSYYWLSFSPRWAGDDRSHRIEVEARRPGLRVRTRRTFTDFSADSRARLNAEGILLLGGDEEGRKLKLEAGAASPETARGGKVPFTLSFPAALFAQAEDFQPAGAAAGTAAPARQLVLAVQSLDSYGNRSLFPEITLPLPLDPQAAPQGVAKYDLALRLARKSQTLLFTLRDPKTGTVIWGELNLHLPAKPAKAG